MSPFASKSQQRYLFAKEPKMAKEWAGKMSSKELKSLPEKISSGKKSKKQRGGVLR